MTENNCFICFNELKDDKYQFDEYILENMPCNCYKYNSVHINCFNAYLKSKIENINKCLLCRSNIVTCIQHSDYELHSIIIDPSKIKYVKEQTPELCLAAVKQEAHVLEFIKEQTEKICLIAVKQERLALKHVKEQTEKICLAAVNKNGEALEFVKEQTTKICLVAVNQTGLALLYVKEQTKRYLYCLVIKTLYNYIMIE